MEEWRSELYHYGIIGMKWGVRRYQNPDGTLTAEGRKRLGYSESAKKKVRSGEKFRSSTVRRQVKFQNRVEKNWSKPYNKATDKFNRKLEKINKKYEHADLGGNHFTTRAGQRYIREVGKTWQDLYKDALISEFGREPISNGKDWVENMPGYYNYNAYIKK